MSKEITEPPFYILDEDKDWARQRIAELEQSIQALGPEFNIALNQSSETWHDNAPFDALRDEQALMVAEMQNLKEVIFKAAIEVPAPAKGRVGIGSKVTVSGAGKNHHYLLAGNWSPRAGHKQDGGQIVVSCESPIGRALLGAKTGQTAVVPTTGRQLTITEIS